MEKHDNVNFKVVDAAKLENVEGLIGRFLAPGAYQVQKSDEGDANKGFLLRAFYSIREEKMIFNSPVPIVPSGDI